MGECGGGESPLFDRLHSIVIGAVRRLRRGFRAGHRAARANAKRREAHAHFGKHPRANGGRSAPDVDAPADSD